MKRILIWGFLILCYVAAKGQSSLLQDKSGSGSIIIGGGKQVSFNAGDASINANIGHDTLIGKKGKFWFGNIKLKSTDGISAILDGTDWKPTIDLSVGFGCKNGFNTFYVGGKLSGAFFNLLKSDGSNTYADRQYYGATLFGGYNFTGSISTGKSAMPYIFGVSINIGNINNLSDLKSVDVYQSNTVTANDTSRTLLQDKKSGYSGNYQTTVTAQVNVDAYLFPNILNNQVGFGGYLRGRAFGYQPRQDLGIGMIVGNKGAPANIAFGVMYQFNDVFNQLGKENQFLKRGGINVVAGYKF